MTYNLTLGSYYVIDVMFRGDLLTFSGVCEEIADNAMTIRPPFHPSYRTKPMALTVDYDQIIHLQEA